MTDAHDRWVHLLKCSLETVDRSLRPDKILKIIMTCAFQHLYTDINISVWPLFSGKCSREARPPRHRPAKTFPGARHEDAFGIHRKAITAFRGAIRGTRPMYKPMFKQSMIIFYFHFFKLNRSETVCVVLNRIGFGICHALTAPRLLRVFLACHCLALPETPAPHARTHAHSKSARTSTGNCTLNFRPLRTWFSMDGFPNANQWNSLRW